MTDITGPVDITEGRPRDITYVMPRRQISLRLDAVLVDRIDARRQHTGLSRDDWLARAAAYVLDHTEAPSEDTK